MRTIGKIVLTFMVCFVILVTIEVAAEVVIDSKAVSYSNAKTNQETVDGALDELFSNIDINKNMGSKDINGTVTESILLNQTKLDANSNILNVEDISDKFQVSSESFNISSKTALKLGDIVFIRLFLNTNEIIEVGKSYTISYSLDGYTSGGGIASNRTTADASNGSYSIPISCSINASNFFVSPVIRNFGAGNGATIWGFLRLIN